jgi:Na+/melibiose symporter-like transporter
MARRQHAALRPDATDPRTFTATPWFTTWRERTSKEASRSALEGRCKISVGVGIFLMVLGAIMAFAMEATTPGVNVNALGVILLLIGLVVVLYSLLFGSSLSPWGRHRVVVRRRTVVEERPVRVVEERPVEVVEERPLDEGLP